MKIDDIKMTPAEEHAIDLFNEWNAGGDRAEILKQAIELQSHLETDSKAWMWIQRIRKRDGME